MAVSGGSLNPIVGTSTDVGDALASCAIADRGP
jgi:hypothetical protein